MKAPFTSIKKLVYTHSHLGGILSSHSKTQDFGTIEFLKEHEATATTPKTINARIKNFFIATP